MNNNLKLIFIVIIISAVLLSIVFYHKDDSNNSIAGKDIGRKEEGEADIQPIERKADTNGNVDLNNKVSELQKTKEGKMIQIVEEWHFDKTKLMGEHDADKKVYDAINKLGEIKSENAIPMLVDKIMFSYSSLDNRKGQGDTGTSTRLPVKHAFPVVLALRDIGSKAAPCIIQRLSQLDLDKKWGKLEAYRHFQSLLEMRDLSREEAVTLLKKAAEKATDEKIKERLLKSASKVEHLLAEK